MPRAHTPRTRAFPTRPVAPPVAAALRPPAETGEQRPQQPDLLLGSLSRTQSTYSKSDFLVKKKKKKGKGTRSLTGWRERSTQKAMPAAAAQCKAKSHILCMSSSQIPGWSLNYTQERQIQTSCHHRGDIFRVLGHSWSSGNAATTTTEIHALQRNIAEYRVSTVYEPQCSGNNPKLYEETGKWDPYVSEDLKMIHTLDSVVQDTKSYCTYAQRCKGKYVCNELKNSRSQ